MRAFRLALAFVKIPRLFTSLLLLPLLASLLIVYVQLVVTGVALKTMIKDAPELENRIAKNKDSNIGRRILYGSKKALPPLKVCRWVESPTDGLERYPTEDCKPDRLDVALKVNNPSNHDATAYEKVFQGNVERLHVCKFCTPDLIIDLTGVDPKSQSVSAQGLLVLSLVNFNDDIQERYLAARRNLDELRALFGDVYFLSSDFRKPVKLNDLKSEIALIFNIGSLVVISLWLALKAHRKVLNYFARSGALLPMVAASGKNVFYSAIWIITLFRVGAFLLGAVPMVYFGFQEISSGEEMSELFGGDIYEGVLWILALVCSLSLATLVASISDLKHRHHILNLLYRYVPLLLCALGSLIWFGSFILDGEVFSMIRKGIGALPIVGMGPLLIAPVFKTQLMILVVHTLLTACLLVLSMKRNAHWFAAHLEEL